MVKVHKFLYSIRILYSMRITEINELKKTLEITTYDALISRCWTSRLNKLTQANVPESLNDKTRIQTRS